MKSITNPEIEIIVLMAGLLGNTKDCCITTTVFCYDIISISASLQ